MKQSDFNSFISLCIQGRIDNALKLSSKINPNNLKKKEQKSLNSIKERFNEPYHIIEDKNPIDELIQIYELYWHASLLNFEQIQFLESELILVLKSWTSKNFGIRSTTKNIFEDVKKIIEGRGLFCITGKVAHIQELEIWKKQPKIYYTVTLPDSIQKVTVFMIQDFLTEGWMSYATCSYSKPGGWAKKDGLYCIKKTYNTLSEKFIISFLTHEAQHFSDYKRFKNLDPFALEYRAKLSELILSKRTTNKLLKKFKAESSPKKFNSHSFASYNVIRNLSKRQSSSAKEIRTNAKALLIEDTEKRRSTKWSTL